MGRIFTVTPEAAQRILDRWNFGNRPIDEHTLEKIRESVARDGWLTERLVEVEGEWGRSRLINGQHRLTVIAQDGVARPLLVSEHHRG